MATRWLFLLAFVLLAHARPQDDSYEYESRETETEQNEDRYTRLVVCPSDEEGKLVTVQGEKCNGAAKRIAIGKYRNDQNVTGWGMLEIETFADYEPELQAYAAGVAEGVLTQRQIYYHFKNTVEDLCKGQRAYCKKLYDYLTKNLDWIRGQVAVTPPSDIYWRQVNLTFTQLTGIYHGYMGKDFRPTVSFDLTPIYMIQLSGELIDLSKFLNKTVDPVQDDPSPDHCSGLIKITEGNKDLMFAQVAMSGYNTMNRVLKLYKFAYDTKAVPGHTSSFSGYAGALASGDDYVLLSSGLASIETTIGIFNDTLYTDRFIKPEKQLHCWLRSIVANQLARTAAEWARIFARYNSGTYNNQWTVLDYKKFTPGQELPNTDVVWVLEQIPGYTMARDMTWFLRKYRYWPSYNVPYLTKITKLSGFDKKAVENNWWKWGFSPRARMFHRDHHKVTDLNSLKALMRYNDYTKDEFSRCDCNPPYTAEAAISARGDLNPVNGTYEIPGMGHRNHGSLDYKGNNYELFKKLRFQAVGGPTYDPVPPFNWNTTDIVAKHFGQPTLWKFDAIITEWETEVHVDL